jgi:hypothetical protein
MGTQTRSLEAGHLKVGAVRRLLIVLCDLGRRKAATMGDSAPLPGSLQPAMGTNVWNEQVA